MICANVSDPALFVAAGGIDRVKVSDVISHVFREEERSYPYAMVLITESYPLLTGCVTCWQS